VPTLKGAASAASAAIFAAMVEDLGGLCDVVPDPQMGIVPRLVSKPLSSGSSPDVLRWSPVGSRSPRRAEVPRVV
jgi:hypothetical protein